MTLSSKFSDFVELTKPRINLLCILMFLGGFVYSQLLSSGVAGYKELFSSSMFFGLAGTWLSVASANTLNMVWERHSDLLMNRTASRPLPSGRMSVNTALAFGLVLAVLSAICLLEVNFVTFVLGSVALFGYVLVYTPLKRVTPHALIIGAVPGAMPPLMGWTAHAGAIEPIGLVLFGILVLWQVPHFIAIAVNHQEDYEKAGIKVLPLVAGEKRAVKEALVYSVALLLVSLLLVPLAQAGVAYFVVAGLLGAWMIALSAKGLKRADKAWAKSVFIASLIYLPVLTGALVVEIMLGEVFKLLA